MKLSVRELFLLWLTVAALLVGGSYWYLEPKVKEMKQEQGDRANLENQIQGFRRLLDQEEEWNKRLNDILKTLPSYPMEQDVTSQLLKTLQQTADKHGLILLRREPDKEKQVGDLFEVAITCTWDGELKALVHFLYDLQTRGAIVDIRELAATPSQAGRLKGSFKVDCAYSRTGVPQGGEPAGPDSSG
ncbi:MAG: type II secretion system protein M [Verrucomicrobia bacterium]|nr:type II secretion system protein M [Verrucomicrobiota bacterium]